MAGSVFLTCLSALFVDASETLSDFVPDPFAYCAQVGNSDVVPDARTGGAFPDSLVAAMVEQGLIGVGAPPPLTRANRWRCMGGSVWVCPLGANLPCDEKAEPSRVPSEAMVTWCKDNPGAAVPAYVTGRATIYSWECVDDAPGADRQRFTPDGAGYLSEFWYPLNVNSD